MKNGWKTNSRASAAASRQVKPRSTRSDSAKKDCAAVSRTSCVCRPSTGMPTQRPADREERAGGMEGEGEGVEGGRGERGELARERLLEADLRGAARQPGGGRHRAPAQADKQPVGAGHVGGREGGVGRLPARLPGDVDVDGVLR